MNILLTKPAISILRSNKLVQTCLSAFYPVAIVFALNSNALDLEKQIEERHLTDYFQYEISQLDQRLLNEGVILAKNPAKLAKFVEEDLLTLWSSAKTLKLLIGSKQLKKSSKEERAQLDTVFNDTFHRYVTEGMSYYDGQRVKLRSVELNDKRNRGFLTVTLTPIYLPAFDIMFKMAKIENKWKLYDILVQGISYIKLKKTEYRRIIHNKDMNSLIEHMRGKNRIKS